MGISDEIIIGLLPFFYIFEMVGNITNIWNRAKTQILEHQGMFTLAQLIFEKLTYTTWIFNVI